MNLLNERTETKFRALNWSAMRLVSFLCIIISMISCSKETIERPVRNDRILSRSVSSELDYFAAALAQAQADPAIRGLIKRAALSNPYDDNCAIYALIKDLQVGGDAFHEILYDNRDQSKSGFDSDFFEEDILTYAPSISIYIYPGDDEFDLTEWDTTLSTGVFAMPDYFTSIYDSIAVYNDMLEVYKIHCVLEPTEPYLSIGENSILSAINLDTELMASGDSVEYRIGAPPEFTCEDFWEALNDDVEGGIYFTVGGVEYLLISEQMILQVFCVACDPAWHGCDGGIDPPGGGDPDCENPDRDAREELEEIAKYTFPNRNELRRTCSWTRKYCKFQINAIFVQVPNNPSVATIQKFHTAKRDNLKGDINHYEVLDPGELTFLKWDLEKLADPMKYNWIYSHPRQGEKYEHQVSLNATFKPAMGPEIEAGGSIKLSYEFKDILLGEAAVYYCDDADGDGTQYQTTPVRFWVKEYED